MCESIGVGGGVEWKYKEVCDRRVEDGGGDGEALGREGGSGGGGVGVVVLQWRESRGDCSLC